MEVKTTTESTMRQEKTEGRESEAEDRNGAVAIFRAWRR